MKVSLIQMNSGRDRDANVERACELIDQAAKEGPDLVVLPELFNTLYFPQYRDYKYIQWAERDNGYTMIRIREKARQHGVYIIATIYEDQAPGIYYDTAMVVDTEGQLMGKYRKTHPAAVGSLEKIYFRYGSKYPVFQIQDWRVGILICYDLLFPESARCLMLNGAELLVTPFGFPLISLSPEASNMPESTGEKFLNRETWLRRWDVLTSLRAIENIVYVAACNLVGLEGLRVFGGGSRIVDPNGKVLATAGTEQEEVISAELDRDLLIRVRQTMPVLRDRRPDLYKAITAEYEDLLL